MLADEELHSGWTLKEELRMWYWSATPADAEERLSAWEEAVRRQSPAELRTLLSFCCTWRQEVLNYFTWPYTNGFVEGKNNRIKAIKRRGYGYRNRDNPVLRYGVFPVSKHGGAGGKRGVACSGYELRPRGCSVGRAHHAQAPQLAEDLTGHS